MEDTYLAHAGTGSWVADIERLTVPLFVPPRVLCETCDLSSPCMDKSSRPSAMTCQRGAIMTVAGKAKRIQLATPATLMSLVLPPAGSHYQGFTLILPFTQSCYHGRMGLTYTWAEPQTVDST